VTPIHISCSAAQRVVRKRRRAPGGEFSLRAIPGHSHDGDDFESIVVCLSRRRRSLVSTGSKRVDHVVYR